MRTGQPTKEDKARKPKHKRYIKQTKFKARWNKKGTKGQFKQLINQILSFLREISSPAARMAQMRSNKRYKPGDQGKGTNIRNTNYVLVVHKNTSIRHHAKRKVLVAPGGPGVPESAPGKKNWKV